MADASRARMLGEIAQGESGASASAGDASHKRLLVRGCDPVMAERASQMLPPMLGGVQVRGVTDDETFFAELEPKEGKNRWDVVMFAPGACRFDKAKQPIPGGLENGETRGWGLAEYRKLVREKQGDSVPIVETTQESEIVPLLRKALGLDHAG